MKNQHYPFVNLPLPYDYDALEPYIDAKTMMLHHDRHLQTYINNLNAVMRENPQLQRLSLTQLIKTAQQLPIEFQATVRNNAGGVYNHRFYFDGLAPPSHKADCGALLDAVSHSFSSFDNFKAEFKKSALSVFGSGYAWLICEKGRLKIITTQNQGSPSLQNQLPILTVDVWEHAYYLKHYNLRGDYIDDWFNVISLEKASNNFNTCVVK